GDRPAADLGCPRSEQRFANLKGAQSAETEPKSWRQLVFRPRCLRLTFRVFSESLGRGGKKLAADPRRKKRAAGSGPAQECGVVNGRGDQRNCRIGEIRLRRSLLQERPLAGGSRWSPHAATNNQI